MQCKYYQILFGQTYEWSLWRGGRFIEVVFNTGSTVSVRLKNDFKACGRRLICSLFNEVKFDGSNVI